jgi:hypothetical protein
MLRTIWFLNNQKKGTAVIPVLNSLNECERPLVNSYIYKKHTLLKINPLNECEKTTCKNKQYTNKFLINSLNECEKPFK